MHLCFLSPCSFLAAGIITQWQGSSRQFSAVLVQCGVMESSECNIMAQEETETLAVMEMLGEEHPSPFINFVSIMSDHNYLSTNFGGLVDNALVYILGVAVRKILKKLSCEVCLGQFINRCGTCVIGEHVPPSFFEK